MSARIIVNDTEVSTGLAELKAKLVNMKPAFADIGEALLNSTRERFRNEIDPTGAKWVPLSKRYARWKAKSGRSKTILQLNGYLFGSLTYQASSDRLELGSNRVYAAIHQFGGRINIPGRTGSVRLRTNARGELLRQGKGGNLAVFARANLKRSALRAFLVGTYSVSIPARPFLGISATDRAEIAEIVRAYLTSR